MPLCNFIYTFISNLFTFLFYFIRNLHKERRFYKLPISIRTCKKMSINSEFLDIMWIDVSYIIVSCAQNQTAPQLALAYVLPRRLQPTEISSFRTPNNICKIDKFKFRKNDLLFIALLFLFLKDISLKYV